MEIANQSSVGTAFLNATVFVSDGRILERTHVLVNRDRLVKLTSHETHICARKN